MKPPIRPAPRAPSQGEGFAAGAAVAAVAVLASRLLGLIREQVFAFFFGASFAYDAFLVAFRIPNLLRDLLAEGALSTAFVAVFSRRLAREGKEQAFALASATLTLLAVFMLGVVALGLWQASTMVGMMAPGFPPDKARLAILLTQVMFPFIFWVSLAAVLMGMLNAMGRFALPQSASSFFNLVSIAVGLGAAYALAPAAMQALWQRSAGAPAVAPEAIGQAMLGMAIGTVAGGAAQFLVQVPGIRRAGFRWRPQDAWRQRGALGEVLRLMGPATLGAAAVQLNVFINSSFASRLGEGPISWLAYAFRLMMFPIGVFGVAVMSAALPALSRLGGAQPQAGFGPTLARGLEMIAFLCLPSAVGLVILGEPVVAVIFEHGNFGPADTRACAAALAAYAGGLPAYAALKLLQPAFVALGDARTPMRVSLASVVLNLGLNALWVVVLRRGLVGLAISTSLLASCNAAVLVACMRRRQVVVPWRSLAVEAAKVMLAAAVAAAVMLLGRRLVSSGPAGAWRTWSLLGVVAPAAAAAYLAAAAALKVTIIGAVVGQLRRRLQG